MRDQVYLTLNKELKKVYQWARNPGVQVDFDVDRVYHDLFRTFSINMTYGILQHIFNLTDILYDSITHDKSEITDQYSVPNAIKDLAWIIRMIDEQKFDEIENDFELRSRLLKVYN